MTAPHLTLYNIPIVTKERNKMQNLLDKYIVDAESRNRNDQYWSEKTISKDQCELAVQEIVGLEDVPVFETAALAKLYFRYSVDYLWTQDFKEPAIVWEHISKKVGVLVEALPWTGRDEEVENPESNLTAPKAAKPKRKTGLDCATEWWLDNLKDLPGLRPGEIQDRMAEECDLHRNSCRGIYYKLKKEYPIPA